MPRLTTQRLRFTVTLVGLSLFAACSTDKTVDAPATTVGPHGGKADEATVECSYETPWLASDSWDLRDAAGDTTKITEADISDLSDTVTGQIFAAAVHLQAVGHSDAFEVVFDEVDGGEVYLATVELDGTSFDWIRFYLGDTEVGTVMEVGTTHIVAEISDGSILACVAPAATVVECSYDTGWLVDSTRDLKRLVTESSKINAGNLQDTDELAINQILIAAVQTDAIEQGASIEDALSATDDGEFERLHVSTSAEFDWIRYYAGDTEVGLVFDAGSTDVVAMVSDGEVMGCKDVAVVPTNNGDANNGDTNNGDANNTQTPDKAECSYDLSWDNFDSSRDMRRVASEIVDVTSANADSVDPLRLAQVLATAQQTEAIGPDDGIAEALDATDDDTFEILLVESVSDYDWVRYYAGDTEVGVVFEADSTNIVAEISDGGVLGCMP